MINYQSAAVLKFAEQRVITAMNNKFSPSVIFITYGYSGFVVFCWILILCRFRNVFVLPPFNFCTSDNLFISKQFRICANAFPNEFTVRSYEYWVGHHWILSWIEENQTETYLRGEIWDDRARITTQLIIGVPVANQESQRPCICVLVVSIFPLSMILRLDFGTVLTVWYFSIRFWNCSDSVVFFY